ncbi:DmsE family decaheme c-type cytochrome [Kineobactrum sediminis]|uniref:DmsE family decaheme c-type cytochrome n=1 Tax=Kineobactrum sediminis TaxID=1905677 RepID=UPI00138FC692|nr:DmsE family decaheme c-type cytochrome [Kineobactrum sediminis]
MTLRALAFALLAALVIPASAADDGADCLGCHTASADAPVHAVFQTVHGGLNGGGNGSCLSCHGDSAEHAADPTTHMPGVSFGPLWLSPTGERNGACTACHTGGTTMHWSNSDHQQEGLACDSCHNSHQHQDPALTPAGSQRMCLDCHSRVQAEMLLPSRHPIAEGKTSCGDCHNPHGSLAEANLRQPTVTDNCLQCHQEKRGPFLWEHPPAAEDCSLCHRPHGAVHERLLITRAPALCQQCHVAAFHPSVPYGSEGLAGAGRNQNILGKNCLNCHSQVHGSNHPSGARLTR